MNKSIINLTEDQLAEFLEGHTVVVAGAYLIPPGRGMSFVDVLSHGRTLLEPSAAEVEELRKGNRIESRGFIVCPPGHELVTESVDTVSTDPRPNLIDIADDDLEWHHGRLSGPDQIQRSKDGINWSPCTWAQYLVTQTPRYGRAPDSTSVTDKATALDRVNVARMLAYVQSTLRQSLQRTIGEKPDQGSLDRFKVIVDGTLDHITKSGLTTAGKVSSAELKIMTWKKLYPRFWTRMAARVTDKLLQFGILQMWKERWYHHLLPFKIERYVQVHAEHWEYPVAPDIDSNEELQDWLENKSEILTDITFLRPYQYIAAQLSIQPLQPASMIHMDFTVGSTP